MTPKLKSFLIALLLVITLSQTAGCSRMGLLALRTAVTVAAVATVLSWHDSHFHHDRCGHQYVYVEDRPVYFYQGRWEYYDDYDSRWYYYSERPR